MLFFTIHYYVLSFILSIKEINPFKLYININNIFTKKINITTTMVKAKTQKKNLMILLTYRNVMFFFFFCIVY